MCEPEIPPASSSLFTSPFPISSPPRSLHGIGGGAKQASSRSITTLSPTDNGGDKELKARSAWESGGGLCSSAEDEEEASTHSMFSPDDSLTVYSPTRYESQEDLRERVGRIKEEGRCRAEELGVGDADRLYNSEKVSSVILIVCLVCQQIHWIQTRNICVQFPNYFERESTGTSLTIRH